jgi:hypothetical protein
MKIGDIDRVNHLVAELQGIQALATHTAGAEPADCEMLIRLPGDASIRMSAEGAASSHDQGFSASIDFLRKLQLLAVEEIEARRRVIVAELAALGVESE